MPCKNPEQFTLVAILINSNHFSCKNPDHLLCKKSWPIQTIFNVKTLINLDHLPCKNLDYFICHVKMVIYSYYLPFTNPDQFNPYSIYKSWSIEVKILISSHIWHYVYIEGVKSLKQTLNSSLNLMQYKVLLIWPHFQQICQPLH